MKKQMCQYLVPRWIGTSLQKDTCCNTAIITYRGRHLCGIHHTKAVLDETRIRIQKQQAKVTGGDNSKIVLEVVSRDQICGVVLGMIPEIAREVRNLLGIPVKEKTPLTTRLDTIPSSTRFRNCMFNYNIIFVGDLALKSKNDIIKYRNLGKNGLHEAELILAKCGWEFNSILSNLEYGELNDARTKLLEQSEIQNRK